MDPITAGKSERTFRVFPNLRQQNDAILDYLGEGGGKRTAIVRLKAPSPDNATKHLLPALKGKGWDVVADVAYGKNMPDYEGVVRQVRASRPDLVLMYVDNEAVPPLLKLIKRDATFSRTKILGGISLAFPHKLPPDILQGVIVAAPKCALSESPRVASSWFGTEFRKRHGKPPHMFAALCFDTAMVLGYALKENRSRPEDVQACLSKLRNHPGVTGSITFDRAGDAQVPWGIGVYKSGKLVPVTERE
jgi:ABC-type branched-subunit amino acid transport system substrate-binding protein